MAPDHTVLEQWYHYEEIAMHFNGLIMQFRLQLLGGAGLIGTLASYLIGAKVEHVRQRHWLRFIVAGGLFILMSAAAALDLYYYDRLLEGAVVELIAFERTNAPIHMSTTIEHVVGSGIYAANLAYLLVLSALGGFTIWSFHCYKNEPRRTQTTWE